MASGALRQISEYASGRSPNPLFAALENHIHGVLIDSTEPSTNRIPDYYVCRRLSSYSTATRNAFLARIPPDIAALVAENSEFQDHIDIHELDLIDFLLSYRNNRVLSIVGTVGVGKTTFIRYVLNDLRKACSSLQPFLPVIMNCLAIGTYRPSLQDLVYEISRSVRNLLSDESARKALHIEQIDKLLADYAIIDTAIQSPAQFVEFTSRLKRACRSGFEPVIVFDKA
jgi:Cdc6-like AAA superfamily ATPase